MIPIHFHRGIELPAHGLWLDPRDDKPFAFVSHAHSDHIGNHREIILSKPTARLMQERLPGKRNEHALEFGETARIPGLDGCEITLLPAGHIFGSAQIFLQNNDADSLLYTGDFKLRPSLSAERTEWRHADALIMETTFGLPKYRFPPAEQIIEQMVAFCAEALSEGAVPVLLGYSLGKSQEILCALVAARMTPMLHGSVFRMTEIYRRLRPDFPCSYERYNANDVTGKVLICPPSAARSAMLAKIKNRRTAVLTGWAVDSGARFRYGCDAAFPLSDHADYTDLIRYVELVQPARVFTLHGFASQFARDLRQRGIEAWALSEENQMEFNLVRPQSAPRLNETSDVEFQNPSVNSVLSVANDSEFAAFASLGDQICATASKLKKIELLREYLRSLTPEQLPIAATYLTGKAFSQTDPRVLQVGWAVIKRALLAVSKATEQELRDISHTHADAGKTAQEILQNCTQPEPLSLVRSREFFESLQAARGPIAKGDLLQKQLARVTPLEAKYLVNIITGDLRIGLKEGLVEESIAAAFHCALGEIKEANMLAGDIGQTALLASLGRLDEIELKLFTPIKVMLASPEPSADTIWKRLSESAATATAAAQTERASSSSKTCHSERSEESLVISPHTARSESGNSERFFADAQDDTVLDGKPSACPTTPPVAWVEDKFDGIRAQLHRNGERVEIFTRDLKRVTAQFDEIAHAARSLRDDVIFDGEIVAFEHGRKLTFFDLQKRLGRKNSADLFSGETGSGAVPVRFMIFDLLWRNGEALLKQPLHKRRLILDALSLPPSFERVEVSFVHSAEEIDRAFDVARSRGNEGLIIKDANSVYTPGRRGLAWLKLKKELATLDVVVVGAEYGHGKRNKVLSDYTFAVRDEKTGELLTIGKAYSGLTDAEIAQLTEHFTAHTISQNGRYRQVTPDVVLEVAFDCVQPSERHTSGLALRFPRIKAIRTDKTAMDIDTLEYARSLLPSGIVPSSPLRSG